MEMKVENRLSCARSAIGNDAKICEAFLFRNGFADLETVSKKFRILLGRAPDIDDFFFGDHEKVDWGRGVDIPKCDGLVVFINDVSGNFPADDFSEDGAHKTLMHRVELVPQSVARRQRSR